MKLYYSPGACSLSPHIALREAGLAFEAVKAPTKTHQLDDGTDYYTSTRWVMCPCWSWTTAPACAKARPSCSTSPTRPRKNLAPANGTWRATSLQEWLTFIGMEIHKQLRPAVQPRLPDEVKAMARDKLAGRLKWVDGELAGKQYLMGDQFTVADGYLFTTTNWAKPTGVDLSGFANLLAYRERVGARPAVQEAMRAEGLMK
jgi:glutathione S-transferase